MDFGGLAGYGVGNGPLSIRIRWHSDGIDDIEDGLSHYGCFIDTPLRLTTVEHGDGYEYLDGTSMASPHVAGAAALAMSFRPDATLYDIKSSILYTGDYLSSLEGKLMIPYRLNILNMLQSLEIPKITQYSHTISGES